MDKNLVDLIKGYKWTKRWAGSYTFISCSSYGLQYYDSMIKQFNTGFEISLQIHKEGTVSCFLPISEMERVAKEVERQIVTDFNVCEIHLKRVMDITDKIMPLMSEMKDTVPSWQSYKEFLDLFDDFLPNHFFTKELINFLPSTLVFPIMDKFKEARIYSEPVYSETERFFRSIMKAVGVKENVDGNLLTCMSRSELEIYLKDGLLPDIDKLQERFALGAIVYDLENETIFTGVEVKNIEEVLTSQQNLDAKEIKGRTGYGGKVQGICRIILDPYKYDKFDEGDILVTGMTRPEFIPLAKKASAIVTDAGGMLCHAAITARELKKPCVIGTEIATKVLKDGDKVEVNADSGLVIKI